MKSAKLVTFNTLISYFRIIITMSLALYSTRLVLSALGAIDYGIFNLIAGVISMMSFLNVAMSTSSQRFFSYYQACNDRSMSQRIFKTSLLLHILIGLIVVVILELVGVFLFSEVLNIPLERLKIAENLYHYMSLIVFFTIISTPFIALLSSYENFLIIMIVGIVEALLKLLLALSLTSVKTDKLLVFGILSSSISIVICLIYIICCKIKYKECSFNKLLIVEKELIFKLLSFAGWNLFGSICFLARTQGLAVLLNIFLGAVVNSAYGISNQVSSQTSFFAVAMLQTLNPQIVKSEGANNRVRVVKLSLVASKYSFFLLAFIAIPTIIEMDKILNIWLKNVPPLTSMFCVFLLIGALINQLTVGLQSGLQAIGKIRNYQIFVGGAILMNLPLAYLWLKLGFAPNVVMITYIIIELFACLLRLYFMKVDGGLIITDYFNNVLIKILIPTVILIISSITLSIVIQFQYSFLLNIMFSSIIFILTIFLTALTREEKRFIYSIYLKLKLYFFDKQLKTF